MHSVSKLILMQCGRDDKAACGNMQLCTGLKACIEGTIHASIQLPPPMTPYTSQRTTSPLPPQPMTHPMTSHSLTPKFNHPSTPNSTQVDTKIPDNPEVHFLSAARNGFNELGCMNMLWEVWHQWPAGSRFTHNLYRRKCRLALNGPPGTKPVILLSCKGGMQRCVWGMILYRIGLMPLAESLQRSEPSILQPW